MLSSIRPLGTRLSSYVKVGDCFKEAAWPSDLCVGRVSGRPGYESRSDPVCGFVMGRPEFISSATFVNSELFASSRLEFLILLPGHVRESRFRNPGNFCLWNPESWALESGIQL